MENSQKATSEASQDEILSEILKKFTFSGGSPPENTATTESASPGTGDMLSAFLSNPELIAKLPTIIATVRPIIEMLGKSAATAAPVSSQPSPEAQTVALGHSRLHGSDSRTALLCAIKPYLGSERQTAIDYVIKLGRLSEILKTL